jgi:hypothetical protein
MLTFPIWFFILLTVKQEWKAKGDIHRGYLLPILVPLEYLFRSPIKQKSKGKSDTDKKVNLNPRSCGQMAKKILRGVVPLKDGKRREGKGLGVKAKT